MTIPSVSQIPDPPDRGAADFDTKAQSLVNHLPIFQGELQAIADALNLLIEATPTGYVEAGGHGECRLGLSGGSLVLTGIGLGRMRWPDGSSRRVTQSETPLAATGNANSTLYYIYLPKAGPIEKSTTGYVIDSSGIAVKSGDASRVLVGMARSTSSGAWADSATQRFVLSHFNRRPLHLFVGIAANRSTGSTSIVEVGLSASERIEFLTWADMPAILSMSGRIANSTANYAARIALWLDGAVPNKGEFTQSRTTAGDISHAQISMCPFLLSEGYHYCGFGGGVNGGGTTTLYTSNTTTGLNAVVWG
ncbi:MAG: hypothetical protein BGO49_00300 [Planctomycetales bacterium 71-10]|nr:MAG: hypothetical protein BGO49_00300 [Planctomycetales bacterium 71-10]